MINWLWFFTIPWIPVAEPVPEVWGWQTDRWTPIVAEALEEYGIPDQLHTFMKVLHCESRGDPYAHNTDVYSNPADQASGLMQHMPRYWDDRAAAIGMAGYSPFDPIANIYASAWLLTTRGGGWQHWSCYGL